MKLNINKFVRHQNIKLFLNDSHLKIIINQNLSTPGILYNNLITVQPYKEYILSFEAKIFGNFNIYPHISTIDEEISTIDEEIFGKYFKKNLLYEKSILQTDKNFQCYYVIKIPENITKLRLYLLARNYNIHNYFMVKNIYFKEFNECIKISNYTININKYHLSLLNPVEFKIPVEISSTYNVNLSSNNIILDSNTELITFDTAEPYIEINHTIFHKTYVFKIFKDIIAFNTEYTFFKNYFDITTRNINLSSAISNQNSTIEYNNNILKVISNQDNNTPGIKFEKILFKKNTHYRLEIYGRKEDKDCIVTPWIANQERSHVIDAINYSNCITTNNKMHIDPSIEDNENLINKDDYYFINKKMELRFQIPDINDTSFDIYILFYNPKLNSIFYIKNIKIVELKQVINPNLSIHYINDNKINKISNNKIISDSPIDDINKLYILKEDLEFNNSLLIQGNNYINVNMKKDLISKANKQIRNQFSDLYNIYTDSTGGGWLSNDKARYSWEYTDILESFIKLYKITTDEYYLDLFVELGNIIINTTDKKLGIKDRLRNNRSVVGWSITRYTYNYWYKNERVHYNHDSDNAIICWKLLEFYNLIYKYNLLKYKNFADEYLKTSIEAFTILEEDWTENPDGPGGYFNDHLSNLLYDNNKGWALNSNWYCAMHSIELFRATKQNKYKEYFTKSCEYFKFYINKIGQTAIIYDDCLTWDYITDPIKQYDSDSNFIKEIIPPVEDTFHGSYANDIIYAGYKENIIFNREDLIKFANTFKKLIWNGKDFETYIDGNRDDSTIYNKYNIGHIINKFLLLSEFDNDIYSIINFFYKNRKTVSDVSLYNNKDNRFYHYSIFVILTFVNLLYYKFDNDIFKNYSKNQNIAIEILDDKSLKIISKQNSSTPGIKFGILKSITNIFLTIEYELDTSNHSTISLYFTNKKNTYQKRQYFDKNKNIIEYNITDLNYSDEYIFYILFSNPNINDYFIIKHISLRKY